MPDKRGTDNRGSTVVYSNSNMFHIFLALIFLIKLYLYGLVHIYQSKE